MKQLAPLVLMALTGCAMLPWGADSGADQIQYSAVNHDPFWLVSVGEKNIVLTKGPYGGRADGELTDLLFSRVPAPQAEGWRIWSGENGGMPITVRAFGTRCTTGGRNYPDRVTVSLSGVRMHGCGGQEIKDGNQS